MPYRYPYVDNRVNANENPIHLVITVQPSVRSEETPPFHACFLEPGKQEGFHPGETLTSLLCRVQLFITIWSLVWWTSERADHVSQSPANSYPLKIHMGDRICGLEGLRVRVKVCWGKRRLAFRRICLICFIIQKKIKSNFLFQNDFGSSYIWTPCSESSLYWNHGKGQSHAPSNSSPKQAGSLSVQSLPALSEQTRVIVWCHPGGQTFSKLSHYILKKFLWVPS